MLMKSMLVVAGLAALAGLAGRWHPGYVFMAALQIQSFLSWSVLTAVAVICHNIGGVVVDTGFLALAVVTWFRFLNFWRAEGVRAHRSARVTPWRWPIGRQRRS